MRISNVISRKISGEWGKEATSDDAVFVIRTANFRNDGKIQFDNLVKRDVDQKKVSKKRLIDGDIIIEKSGGSPKQPVGRVVYFEQPFKGTFLCNNFTSVLRPGPSIVPKYLFYHLSYNYLIGKTRSYQNKTTGIINLKLDRYLKEELYVPDLQTQQQIVEALDRAQSLIEKREKSIELLDESLRATFLDLFGDPYINEKNWEELIVGDVVERIEAGWSVAGEKRPKVADEFGVLKVSAVTSGRFKAEEHKAVDRTKIKKKLVVPEKGDVLFSRANTMELVAATCIVDETDEKLFLPDKLWKIHLKEENITPEYFVRVLKSPSYRRNLALKATGSSGSMLNISQKKLLSYQFPKPPIKLQKEYSNIYRALENHRKKLIQFLKQTELLFQSLLQRAFHGDLTFQSELQLDALIENYDVEAITKDGSLIQELVDRFNQHNQKEEFIESDNGTGDFFSLHSFEEYESAKELIFKLMKSDKVEQRYDQEKKQTILQMK